MGKYIITGGEGFIGSKVLQKVEGESYDIKSGLDIRNQKTLEDEIKSASGIFHCAAKISVPESILMPNEYFETNVTGLKNVVALAEKIGAKIVFSSSAAVYGEYDVAVKEDFDLSPKSPYAENKRDGEIILKNAEVPAIALRYFNVYGPGQSSQYAGVITAFIKNAIEGKDIVIHGDGNQVRDFVYVDDVVEANIMAMNYSGSKYDVFNIASGKTITINELAKMILDITGSKSKIIHSAPREGDIFHSSADISKVINILGWKPKVSMEDGLRRTIESFR